MDIGKAAEILQHYIELALTSSPTVVMTSDMTRELNEATQSFRDAAETLESVYNRGRHV